MTKKLDLDTYDLIRIKFALASDYNSRIEKGNKLPHIKNELTEPNSHSLELIKKINKVLGDEYGMPHLLS